MDVLGLFARLQSRCRSVHRKPQGVWHDERHGCPLAKLGRPPRNRLLPLPAAFLRLHGKQEFLSLPDSRIALSFFDADCAEQSGHDCGWRCI